MLTSPLCLVGAPPALLRGRSSFSLSLALPEAPPHLLLHLGVAEGAGGQVIRQVLVAAVRGLHLPAEEQHGLWAGIWPRQDPLFVHTAQDLQGEVARETGAGEWQTGTQGQRKLACEAGPRLPQGLTVTEPRLCSRLELWLSVGDVPWITRRKWPQMLRSISWWQKGHEAVWDSATFPRREPLGTPKATAQGHPEAGLRRHLSGQGSDTLPV